MSWRTWLKPVYVSHYKEFLHLSSQMGLRLTGTAGLSQPISGLSCCCWISRSLAWNLKEASCRLGLQGSAALALVLKRFRNEAQMIPFLSCRRAVLIREWQVSSNKANANMRAVGLLHDCILLWSLRLRCVSPLSVNLPGGGGGMGWPIVWHRSTCVLSEMRSAH